MLYLSGSERLPKSYEFIGSIVKLQMLYLSGSERQCELTHRTFKLVEVVPIQESKPPYGTGPRHVFYLTEIKFNDIC